MHLHCVLIVTSIVFHAFARHLVLLWTYLLYQAHLLTTLHLWTWQTLMLIFADIRLYVLTHGHTGTGHQQRECSNSSNTLATNQTSTRWEGTNCTGYCYCMMLCCSSRTRKYLFSHSVSWNIYIFSISSYFSRTKIFIRHPRTLFATEDAFEICKHELGKAPVTSDKRRRWFLQCHSFDLIGWCLQSLLLQPQESRLNTKAIGWKENTKGRGKQVWIFFGLKYYRYFWKLCI